MKGKVRVLGDALSRAPHVTSLPAVHVSNTNADSLSFQLPPRFISNFAADATFRPIHAALCGSFPSKPVQREQLPRLLPHCCICQGILLNENKDSVPHASVRQILALAYDDRSAGHFTSSKTLSRLQNFHWRHKARNVEQYCSGCSTCQLSKDH